MASTVSASSTARRGRSDGGAAMTDWNDEAQVMRTWLFARCVSIEEFQFWTRLWDDLTDMVDWPDMDPEFWYQHFHGVSFA